MAESQKNPVGRPTKYKEEYNDQAYKLCLLGATDAKLADFFGVCVDTINEWKLTYNEFSASIKKGKEYADAVIAESLYNRALGMTINKQVAVKLTEKTPDGNGWIHQTEDIKIVTLTEDVPPDPTSVIFWLKNRQPKEWRDKQEVNHSNNGSSFENGVSETQFNTLLNAARNNASTSGTG